MAQPRVFGSLDELRNAVGEDLGTSDWLEIDQKRIDLFADATGDHQWIHVDPERAAAGPFGATIAHGYLTLALLPALVPQLLRVDNVKMGINYGVNKVRFPAPVPVGSRLRATARIADVTEVPGGVQLATAVTVEREGGDKPVCVAETLSRFLL
ncbi:MULTISPECIES: MaoC family dehydratase [Streptomyces]|uniref:MaoC family dehydratase n=2 Tax=Streptomyces rimosus subsp. rimosus TaxID=132474 RepID=L8EJB6_STRR1|nr:MULTISPECIES: MaoC family dehydratase [Streptomyces]KOG68621.1 dehydratase [Kitasatospora aureofaciens]MYT45597.1 dehydratase [Streptomyces sp. SID5471]KEF04954.1 dehydratase [Streptomyces rimosus]KOT35553.1 dehydratase [Streptomyces rimosus subsp. rimosus]KOT36875.1 dehydratase [Streptomyces sp. NRRL WC-3701]